MAVEEHFAIEIPEEDAGNVVIVGSFHQYLLERLEEQGRIGTGTDQGSEEQVWNDLSSIIQKELGVRADQIRPETHIVNDLGVD
jgi:acyl carrier protein